VPEPAKSEQDPDPRVFARLADAYRREGLLDEAIQICRDGLAAHPGHAGGREVLARALLERGALEEAEQEFRRVLEQVPAHLPALRSLGDISVRQGRPQEARRYYERALHLNPDDSETQARLAALPVATEAGPSGGSVPASGRNRDPLASPTLAALYASQGHAEVAEAIYSQLGRRPGEAAWAATSGDASDLGQVAPGSPVLAKLLSLREAARRLREAGRPEAGGKADHGP
jgi:tetratricopeptide (TPR) repeat protein